MTTTSTTLAADTNGSSSSSPAATGDSSNNSTSTNSSASNTPQQQNWMLLAVISVAVLFVLVLGMVSFVLLRRRKKLKETEELECEMTTNATKATQFIHGSISTLTRGENGTGMGMSGYHPEFEYLPNDIRTDEEMQPFRLQQKEVVRGRMIAKGGYGAVYKAKFRSETVVVKQLLPDKTRNKQILKSFMDEIRICAALDHPKIVRFIGVTWSSLLDLSVVMEYMSNGDLGSLLTEQLQRQASGTVSRCDYGWFQTSGGNAKCKSLIALDIAEALVYLHSFISPIIHRDLKSRNVLLSRDWEAKLTDFGVSRELDEDQTMTGEIGTVSWIAPEVLRGERYTEKADIYSFGVIMTELDTCRRPYSDGIPNEDNGGGSNQHTNTRIAVLVSSGSLKPSINDDCPSSVRRLISQCLEVDPKNRPSAVQIHFELRNLDMAEEQRRETATIKRSGSSFSTRASSKPKSGSR